jgi:hypothetical protein
MCWVYRRNGSMFEVGYYLPLGIFEIIKTYVSEYDARTEVHFLNGGNPDR